jgi:predicted nucleotidyltransferase
LKEFFRSRPEIELAYLFGSVLKRPDWRDLDIAVLLDQTMVTQRSDWLRYGLRVGAELEQFLGRPRVAVDLRVLNDASLAFQNEVIKTGALILARDRRSQVAYESRVLVEFLDFLPILEMYERALRREIRQWS